MRKFMIAAGVAALMVPGAAFAQEGTAAGVAGGAATGAVLGGPVGAVVGGIAGGVVGTAIDPPPAEVRTYVQTQPVEEIRVERKIVVGEALPETVTVHRVPNYDRYSYAYVNGDRVIVEPRSRKVIEVID